MNRTIKGLVGIISCVVLLGVFGFSSRAYAASDVPYFDFQDTVMSINAGESKTMWFRSDYNYTYYVGNHSSAGTYIDCSFKSGSQNITIHIGADETVKNVFFHFYIDDERLQSTDTHDSIEVYVQNISATSSSVAAPIAGGKTGTVAKQGNTAMLYNESGVAMASFSLANGTGNMGTFSLKGIVGNGGSNYIDVVSASGAYYPAISESDKAVMLANGYAGVCVNGTYKNW